MEPRQARLRLTDEGYAALLRWRGHLEKTRRRRYTITEALSEAVLRLVDDRPWDRDEPLLQAKKMPTNNAQTELPDPWRAHPAHL